MNSEEKWEKKHKERLKTLKEPAPNVRLKNLAPYFNGGSALDLACGLGGNSLFLAEQGYTVEAVDLSVTAVNYVADQAEKLGLKVDASVQDLADFSGLPFAKNSFDLIVISYYLDQQLFTYTKDLMKEGGYYFIETYFDSPNIRDRKVSGKFMLRPQELLDEFRAWQVLYFEENELEGRQTIFCRKDAIDEIRTS
ncbi:class I SAM-dependent methyltransferase [Bacillus sp. B-jedd]|uniref:class I SAM-dependent methyltransferase n=1 Tax=Bacillus sp. B-jedd TaxID=1476857 RepID=UPI0005157000|nr:class I SAM-dependent methyltransferase [Bacillus sp. B-jedd]CEG26493.1 methyltransferase type 12 protein [Bacillus sp. B-jedd]